MKYIHLAIFILLITIMNCSPSKTVDHKQHSPNINFSSIDFKEAYRINDEKYKTATEVKIENGKRFMTTNSLPNHATGDFPNEGNPNTIKAQDKKYSFDLSPQLTGESKWAREPGVAVNGIKFEPETAERFVCETGEVYKIEAIQDLVDLGLDFNHAHVQPTGAYHYHGVPTELIKMLDKGDDLILVGYAKDGFPMYYSKSGKYKPSFVLSEDLRNGDLCTYRNPHQSMEKEINSTRPDGTFVSDWIYTKGVGQLDECNGIEVNGTYAYFITDEYPYVSRCLKGIFKENHPHGPPPGMHSHGGKKHRHR